jgi:hypothetical protein
VHPLLTVDENEAKQMLEANKDFRVQVYHSSYNFLVPRERYTHCRLYWVPKGSEVRKYVRADI